MGSAPSDSIPMRRCTRISRSTPASASPRRAARARTGSSGCSCAGICRPSDRAAQRLRELIDDERLLQPWPVLPRLLETLARVAGQENERDLACRERGGGRKALLAV